MIQEGTLRLIKPWTPAPGERGYRFVNWFCDNINFCHEYYYGTDTPKPENRVYNILYEYWSFPFEQPDCICCNTVRGLIYGGIIGFILGRLI